MRTLRFVLSVMLIGTALVKAEEKAHTDAQQDGLNGPVRSVSLIAQKTQFRPDPTTAWAIHDVPSENIEYDSLGYRTRMGELTGPNGEFQGQMSQFVRDANGRVIERTITQMPSKEVIERDVYGPFGLVESTSLSFGKPTDRHTVSYDQQGNVKEDVRLDGEGKPIFGTLYRRTANGAWTERTTWLRGVLHSHETYDPDSDVQRYEEYNESGDVTTTFLHHHGRVESYWSALNDTSGGTSIIDKLDNGNTQTWHCHNEERACDGHTLLSVYVDAAKHNPRITEILSDDATLLVRAYYDYQMDEHQNFTSRKVWVQLGERGERTLYEIDSRTITYWPE